MDKISEAVSGNQTTYFTGKPCRRGHVADRYVSNGCCVECVKQRNSAMKDTHRLNRRKLVNAMVNNFRERTFLVREDDRITSQQFFDILQYGDETVRTQLKNYIENVHDVTPNPKALTHPDIVKIVDWRDGRMHNYGHLLLTNVLVESEDDEKLYLHHNNYRYPAEKVAEVLRGTRLAVFPV